MFIAPAFSAPASVKVFFEVDFIDLNNFFVCLYPQCSLQSAPNSPNSRSLGSLPNLSTISLYSDLLRAN